MTEKIAVTGRPGCGKTTLCRKVVDSFKGNLGGLLTEEIRKGEKRVGFKSCLLKFCSYLCLCFVERER